MSHDCTTHPGATNACAEYRRLTRRSFVGGAVAAAGALAAHSVLPRVSLAASHRSAQRDVLVNIFLRGGADGLTICAPFGDPAYYTLRPKIGIPRPDSTSPNKAAALDSFFGLPPAMFSLLPVYQAGKLLFVHACGSGDSSRSHFKQQRWMEVGRVDDPGLNTGWLGRCLNVTPPMNPQAMVRAMAISESVQRSLYGADKVVATTWNPDNFGLPGGTTAPRRKAAIEEMYATSEEPLFSTALSAFDTVQLLDSINFAGYQPGGGAVYPTDPFGVGVRSAAALIRAQIGVEVISLDLYGWDTHFDQGNANPNGLMYRVMQTLARSLAALFTDLNSGSPASFTVMVMSEFGREVKENDSLGTDHGHGGLMMLMGNAVLGGRVLTQWPGLGDGQLFQNQDLAITIDYRDIVGEVLADRLGCPGLGQVFPGYTPNFRGVTR